MRRPGDSVIAGIGLGVLGYALFAFHDAAIKFLVETLSVWQVLLFRSLTVIAACVVFGGRPVLARVAATPLKRALIFRAVLTMTAWICYYSAARALGLGQLLTLYFAAPLVITLLAAPLLGETVTPVRWLAVGLGFVGVLFAADPFGVTASLDTVLVLISAALWGYATILMRRFAAREPSLLQMLFNNATFLPLTAFMCIQLWTEPSGSELLLLLSVGVIGGLAQYTVFEMARRTPASVMASVEYSALIWAFALGWLIWGDIPGLGVWVGAALIAGSGLILVLAERQG
jgi:drug/metabolite transporter (DMT)-like permease